jgi:hypothetical protein
VIGGDHFAAASTIGPAAHLANRLRGTMRGQNVAKECSNNNEICPDAWNPRARQAPPELTRVNVQESAVWLKRCHAPAAAAGRAAIAWSCCLACWCGRPASVDHIGCGSRGANRGRFVVVGAFLPRRGVRCWSCDNRNPNVASHLPRAWQPRRLVEGLSIETVISDNNNEAECPCRRQRKSL